MKTTIRKYILPVVSAAVLIVTVSSCSKDNYYKDGGTVDPHFKGTILQYLQSNPQFDTIAKIVHLAGMDTLFSTTKQTLTFFAPTDEVIRTTIGAVHTTVPDLQGGPGYTALNQILFNAGKDTIQTLDEIPAATWRKYLMRYVFKGSYLLKDYPQLDFTLRPLFPGGYYQGYNGDLANIGVVYATANTVRYSGYRQLCIASVTDPGNPQNYYNGAAAVSSSDIQPTNGVIHTLAIYFSGVTSTPNLTGELQVNPIMSNLFGMSMDFDNEILLNR
ncbi:fasciclin domain-containing protein [Mucilaginibacter sp. dw_454]|uniref:fasciclin domain-containing protein n=1 Tax=Mucilaginibacter sp. dw_454 TaxID=2720079 RepID=UPI001BD5BC5B|nr:fasciclin domain-containing protein [Mucilaginibacter sp. dw_454]